MPASAQSFSACPGLPLEREVVDNDPIYQNICLDKPPSCSVADPPVVITDPAEDLLRAQSVVLEAGVPSGFVADRVLWKAESIDPATGARIPLWEHESGEGIQTDVQGDPIAGPYAIRFGAPGLVESADHQFRVSFRRASDGFWLCWSLRSAVVATPGFQSFGPNAPVTREVEDDFRRPETTTKFSGGDGLGPDAVWIENTGAPTTLIDSDGDPADPRFSALLNATSSAMYALEASEAKTYDEGLFRRDQPGSYNIELATKIHPTPPPLSMNYYYLKLVFGHRGCTTDPTMFLVRADEGNLTTCPGSGLPADAILTIPDAGQAKCNAVPPLGSEDAADTFSPKRSEPVWLRIEVDIDVNQRQVLTGTVAWNCPDGENISECANVCTLTRTDQIDFDLVNIRGEWGFWVHDQTHYLDFFRAGSDPY